MDDKRATMIRHILEARLLARDLKDEMTDFLLEQVLLEATNVERPEDTKAALLRTMN